MLCYGALLYIIYIYYSTNIICDKALPINTVVLASVVSSPSSCACICGLDLESLDGLSAITLLV